MVFYKGVSAKPLIAERSNIIPTSTNVTSRGANDNIELREIRVERTVDVDHCIWDSTSGLEARASNVF